MLYCPEIYGLTVVLFLNFSTFFHFLLAIIGIIITEHEKLVVGFVSLAVVAKQRKATALICLVTKPFGQNMFV